MAESHKITGWTQYGNVWIKTVGAFKMGITQLETDEYIWIIMLDREVETEEFSPSMEDAMFQCEAEFDAIIDDIFSEISLYA